MDMPDPNAPTACDVHELRRARVVPAPGLSRNELESAEQLVSTRLRIRGGGAAVPLRGRVQIALLVWRGL